MSSFRDRAFVPSHAIDPVLVICPGFHEKAATQAFLTSLTASIELQPAQILVIDPDRTPVFSGVHIFWDIQAYLKHQLGDRWQQVPLLFIGFSAGIVGAAGAVWKWNASGGCVKALIALDGWGVPLWGEFPIHRLSHDSFTHWSSALLGAGLDSFYADPGVEHLDLWRSPQTAIGWHYSHQTMTKVRRTSAQDFLKFLLNQYLSNNI